MSTSPQALPSPVVYPALRINGTEYQFRYTRTSQFLLESWGYDLAPGKTIPALAWAASMAGTVNSAGVYRSSGFRNPAEFVDQIALEDDLNPLYEAVTEALKKVAPKATLTLVPSPGADSTSTSEPSAK
jgi:hypothetical protein